MDARFAHEDKMRKRTRRRWICSLCNESSRDPYEQFEHHSSGVHKHMKRIKQKQYAYTKNLRTLDEKIKASVEHNEALIGLEYIYQYAADKEGAIPYVCDLCNRVYKLDNIFFHIVGFKHRCLYLSKHFPALGIDPHFKAITLADCTKLLNASEVIEKCHGRKKINVSSKPFDPTENGMKYDSDSGHEGLSSEDEQNNSASTKPEWETDIPFQHDPKSGPPIPHVDRGGPAFQYDDGQEVQDDRRDMKRSLRDHDVSGYQRDGHSDRNYHKEVDRLPMELSYQHRGHDSKKVPGRTDFHGGSYASSQMHQDGKGFHHDDDLHGGPRQSDNQVRNKDFTFQHDLYKRSLGDPHGGTNMGSLPQKDRDGGNDGVRGPNLQSHRGGAAFQYDVRQSDRGTLDVPSQVHRVVIGSPNDDRRGQIFQGGAREAESQVRNNDRDLAFRHGQSSRSLDLDMPSTGPLSQQLDRDGLGGPSRVQNHPPKFPGDPNFEFEMDRERMVYRYGDVALRGDQNADDVKSHNRTLNHPSGFLGDHDFPSRTSRGEMGFQYDDRHRTILQDGPRHIDNRLKDSHSFAIQHDQNAGLLGSAHGDSDMPSLRLSRHQVDRDALHGQNRTQNHSLGFSEDSNLNSRIQRDGMAFQYDAQERPTMEAGPRPTDRQVRNNDRELSFGHDQRLGDAHGALDRPSVGPLNTQLDYDDIRGFPAERLLCDVRDVLNDPSMKSFYPQGDGQEFDDRSLYSDHRGGMVHDGHSGNEGPRFPMHGELLSFQEIKAAHEAGVSLGPSDMDEQDTDSNSDMEVRSMDLSDCDPDQFLCNTELFEYVRTFKIYSYGDEQFALKVRDLLTNCSIRYKKRKEDSLKRRIAKEKEQLEEEKQAFLKIQIAREGPKAKHQQPSTLAPDKIQVPDSTSQFPDTTSGNRRLANKPIPLMSLVIGRQKERRSRWAPESTPAPSEMRLERSNPLPERDFFSSRAHNEDTRNLPSRFTTRTGSMRY